MARRSEDRHSWQVVGRGRRRCKFSRRDFGVQELAPRMGSQRHGNERLFVYPDERSC